jgi:hypothetical protein
MVLRYRKIHTSQSKPAACMSVSEGQINTVHVGRVVQVNNILLLLYVFSNGMPLVPKYGMSGMCDSWICTNSHCAHSIARLTNRPHVGLIWGTLPAICLDGLNGNITEQSLFGPTLNASPSKYERELVTHPTPAFDYFIASCNVGQQSLWYLFLVSSQSLAHFADGRIHFSHSCESTKNTTVYNKQNCNYACCIKWVWP